MEMSSKRAIAWGSKTNNPWEKNGSMAGVAREFAPCLDSKKWDVPAQML